MSRPRHGRDGNEPDIIRALTEAGTRVRRIESPDDDEPDLLVGFLGRLTLLEVKVPKTGRLTEGQKKAREEWARVGVRVYVVHSVREAFDAVGITGPRAARNHQALAELALSLRKKSQGFEQRTKLVPSQHDYRGSSAWEDAHQESPIPDKVLI